MAKQKNVLENVVEEKDAPSQEKMANGVRHNAKADANSQTKGHTYFFASCPNCLSIILQNVEGFAISNRRHSSVS